MPELEPILYVDDEEGNLNGFKYSFLRDYKVHIAASAAEGLKILEQQTVKIVVSDQRMPVMTGIEFFDIVSKKYPDLILIILSAFTDVDTVMMAINKGTVYRYITKPWNKNDLKTTINNALEAYNLKNKNQELISNLQEANSNLSRSNEALKQEMAKREKAQIALQKSEFKFRNIFESSNDSIIISGFDGEVLETNDSFVRLIGYTVKELAGMKTTDFIHSDDVFEVLTRREMLKSHKMPAIELRLISKNQQSINVELNSSLIDYQGQQAILSIVRDLKERKEYERKILETIIETEEKERKRFAADIHDGLGPLLSTLKLYYKSLLSPKYPEEKKKLIGENIHQVLEEAIETTRTISNNLMPNILNDFGLVTAVESFCKNIRQTKAIAISLKAYKFENRLPQTTEVVLYRVLLELVNNTIKHAQANEAGISISKTDNKLLINYYDNGIGCDLSLALKKRKGFHLGLNNIINRLKSIGGLVEFNSEEGKGFSANITVQL